ncbi:MAG TPA: penicillin acylase family protein, partial [Polyangiales bacterium]
MVQLNSRGGAYCLIGMVVLGGCEATPEAAPLASSAASLHQSSQIVRDHDGIPHVYARTETELLFLQGYAHARDRLFQMDTSRRRAEGTLAELLGEAVLRSDVELRTFGIRRAAERSLTMLSPEARAGLSAYAAGVNAWAGTNPLPPEYQRLELTQFRPWSEIDSLSVLALLGFQLSFDVGDLRRTQVLQAYVAAGAQNDFDGALLFSEDVARQAPFEPTAAVSEALQAAPRPRRRGIGSARMDTRSLDVATLRSVGHYLERLHHAPEAEDATRTSPEGRGSNGFVVSGRFSRSGEAML